MKDLTVIIPLVEYRDELSELYKRSIESVNDNDLSEELSLIFVGPTSSIKYIKDNFGFGDRDVLFLENNKNVEPQFQINKAVKDVKTTYFSILEFDDNYTNIWFKNVKEYIEYYPETSLFLPLIEVFDYERPELGGVAYANEPVWSTAFSEEIGYLDVDAVKNYYNFIVSGGVFKKSDFIAVGGLKNNIKVFFWYEFLLRLVNNEKKAFVIPKVGYEHYVNVNGSLSSRYGQMDRDELDFWFTTAQEEYLFKTDRKKTYNTDSE
jgi:hypothetical protein